MDTKQVRNFNRHNVNSLKMPTQPAEEHSSSAQRWFSIPSDTKSFESIESIANEIESSKQFWSLDNHTKSKSTFNIQKPIQQIGSEKHIFNHDFGSRLTSFQPWNRIMEEKSIDTPMQQEKLLDYFSSQSTSANSSIMSNINGIKKRKECQPQNTETSYLFQLDETSNKADIPYISAKLMHTVLSQHLEKDNSIKIARHPVILKSNSREENSINGKLLAETKVSRDKNSRRCWLFSDDTSQCNLNSESKTSAQQRIDDCKESSSGLHASTDIPQTNSVFNTEAINKVGLKPKLVILDSRYKYEYDHGHISTALNISSPAAMQFLFGDAREYLFRERFVNSLLGLEGQQISVEHLRRLIFEHDNLDDSTPAFSTIGNNISESDSTSCFETIRNKTNMPIRDNNYSYNRQSLISNYEWFKDTDMLSSDNMSDFIREDSSTLGPISPRDCVPVLVFHCEFSTERGPRMWRLARRQDRHHNIESYPFLDFDQCFVLRGGYESFVSQYGEACMPEYGYLSMFSEDHREELRQEDQRKATEWKIVKKP